MNLYVNVFNCRFAHLHTLVFWKGHGNLLSVVFITDGDEQRVQTVSARLRRIKLTQWKNGWRWMFILIVVIHCSLQYLSFLFELLWAGTASASLSFFILGINCKKKKNVESEVGNYLIINYFWVKISIRSSIKQKFNGSYQLCTQAHKLSSLKYYPSWVNHSCMPLTMTSGTL